MKSEGERRIYRHVKPVFDMYNQGFIPIEDIWSQFKLKN